MSTPAPALTLPEELILLALDPERGKPLCSRGFLRYATAGASLAELELQGRIREERGRVQVVNPLDPADPLLAHLLRTLDPPGKSRFRSGTSAKRWVRQYARYTEENFLETLVGRGVLRRETARFLGLFPYERHFPGDPDLGALARWRFHQAEAQGFPDSRSRVLAAMAAAIGLATTLSAQGRGGRSTMKLLLRAQWTALAVHRNVKQDRSSGGGGSDSGGWGDGGGGGGCGGGGGD
ncbi:MULTISPECIES: GPP34 family phosphoprotein [unclassified Streptomyces]|uniref:GOLPH3/VPS74 family protein n=1 Tax=unclassified Streptomyces TaxID=2593676 RepID=UPI003450529B